MDGSWMLGMEQGQCLSELGIVTIPSSYGQARAVAGMLDDGIRDRYRRLASLFLLGRRLWPSLRSLADHNPRHP